MQGPPSGHPRRLYAHRGAAAELPENTLQSFRRALILGATALEMDVHMTSDKVVVVSHDASGRRMCGVDREIRRCTAADVTSWDAGWGFTDPDGQRPFADRGFCIPTLDDVLGEFPDTIINIDVKQLRPPMVERVLGTIEDHRAADRVLVASFHLSNLLSTRLRRYPGATSLSRAEVALALAMPASVVRRLPLVGGAAQLPTGLGRLKLGTQKIVDHLHDAGLRVDYWTINDPHLARHLLELGADGIMTDDPRGIAPVFQETVTAGDAPTHTSAVGAR